MDEVNADLEPKDGREDREETMGDIWGKGEQGRGGGAASAKALRCE